MKHKIGSRVQLNEAALENYGQQYAGKSFVVLYAANKYMPAAEFYKNGCPQGYHPGYDTGVSPQGLYDLAGLDFSVYDWELC